MNPQRGRIYRIVAWSLAGLCLMCLFAPDIFLLLFFVIPFYLGVGWTFFISRTLPHVTPDGSAIVTALVCLAAFTVGLHGFLTWLAVERRRLSSDPATDASPAAENVWPARRTLLVVGLTLTLFVAGVSMLGMAHQVVWLMTGPEPTLVAIKYNPASMRMFSANNLKQLGIALHNYHDMSDSFPPGATIDQHGRLLHGWQTFLLPYLEQQQLFDRIDRDKPWNDPAQAEWFRWSIGVYENPLIERRYRYDDDGFALSDIAGNAHLLGGVRRWRLAEITDGASHTMLAGEVVERRRPWGYPANWRDPALGVNRSPEGFGGPWSNPGVQVTLADGSVRFLSADTDPAVLRALATPNGGETVTLDGRYASPP